MIPARPRVVTGLALAACSYALFATQDATVKIGFSGVVIAAGPLGAVMSRPALGALAADRYTPASAAAPIEYTGLVWAFLYGYAIWAARPRWNTFAGAALIAAGSLAQVWFENRRAIGEPALPVPR